MKSLVFVVALTLLPTGIAAESATCEDTLRVFRILSEQYIASRSRTEIEAAQTIAKLQKRIEALQAEAEAMRAAAPAERR